MVTPPGRRPRVSRVDGQPRAAATRVDPLAGAGVVSHAARSCEEPTVVIMVVDADQAETDLAAGRLACPRCGGRLRPWSWATARLVRQLDGTTTRLRPRRARCQACRGTQVLLPGWCLPRRADAAEVIGAALVAPAHRAGPRTERAGRRRRRLPPVAVPPSAGLDVDHHHHRRPAARTLRMIIKHRFPGTPMPATSRHRADQPPSPCTPRRHRDERTRQNGLRTSSFTTTPSSAPSATVNSGGVGEQVPDDDQDGSGNRDEGFELASAFDDAPVALTEEGVGLGRRGSGLAEDTLEVRVALA